MDEKGLNGYCWFLSSPAGRSTELRNQKNLKLKSIYRIDRDRSESELQEKCNNY
jgi:hypothetical protein